MKLNSHDLETSYRNNCTLLDEFGDRVSLQQYFDQISDLIKIVIGIIGRGPVQTWLNFSHIFYGMCWILFWSDLYERKYLQTSFIQIENSMKVWCGACGGCRTVVIVFSPNLDPAPSGLELIPSSCQARVTIEADANFDPASSQAANHDISSNWERCHQEFQDSSSAWNYISYEGL